jgi:hypothetical protein
LDRLMRRIESLEQANTPRCDANIVSRRQMDIDAPFDYERLQLDFNLKF